MENQSEQIAKILELTESTNKMVRSMERRRKMSSFLRLIYIGLIIYASWWGYKQLMPYMDQMKSLIIQVQEMNKSAGEMSKTVTEAKVNLSPEVQKLLDKLPK